MSILDILTNDGEAYTVEDKGFDAIAVNEKLNNPEVNTVIIGGNIFGRFDIKRIVTKD